MTYVFLWLVKDNEAASSLIKNTVECLVQYHLWKPGQLKLAPLSPYVNRWQLAWWTHFVSTCCVGSLTMAATCDISTLEKGSMILTKFCSRSVSYKDASWLRMMGSLLSSIKRWQVWVSRYINHVMNPTYMNPRKKKKNKDIPLPYH
jgi:hypothetical protein